jgi:uncharacterized Zn finger protein
MALSSCQKCAGHSFELVENSPRGAHFKSLFIQCTSCGTVVGATTYYDAGHLSHLNQNKLEELSQQLADVQHQLSVIQRHLQ